MTLYKDLVDDDDDFVDDDGIDDVMERVGTGTTTVGRSVGGKVDLVQ